MDKSIINKINVIIIDNDVDKTAEETVLLHLLQGIADLQYGSSRGQRSLSINSFLICEEPSCKINLQRYFLGIAHLRQVLLVVVSPSYS